MGYVGSQNRFQDLGFSAFNFNAVKVIAPPGLNSKTFRQFPDFNSVSQFYNVGKGNYNSLQATYDKRFTGGFAAKANYTFSKCRTQGRQGLVNNIGNYQNIWLLGPDYRALCDTDVKNLISGNFSYVLSFR